MSPFRQTLRIAADFSIARHFVTPTLLAVISLASGTSLQAQIPTNDAPRPSTPFQENQFSFPTEPVRYDPNVQVASHESADLPSTEVTSASVASTSDLEQMWANTSSFVQAQWEQGGWSEKLNSTFGGADIGRMLGSLAVVLGGYFGFVGLMGLLGKKQNKVPAEVLELLGSVQLSPKKHLKIVRLGSKLLLLIDGEEGTHSIGEISDPNEVEYLSSLCRGKNTRNDGVTHRIRQAAQQLADRARPNSSAASTPATENPSVPAGLKDTHLATLLEALSGPRNGTAAVFEG